MPTSLKKCVTLCEVGLRDGLQNEKVLFTAAQKVGLIEALADAGHTVIEVGSFMHPAKVPAMANTDEVFQLLRQRSGVEYRAMVPNLRGVERAIACGCKKIRMSVSASRAHNLANFNCAPEDTVSGFADICQKAGDHQMEAAGGIMMAFGSPWEAEIPPDDIRTLVETYLSLGIREISLADSAGLAAPDKIYQVCSMLRGQYPQVERWVLHLHNTRGMGMANLLAGIKAGFTHFDTSFAGLGGCPFIPGAAGNLSTEDALHMLDLMEVETGIDLDRVIGLGKQVAEMVGHRADSYVLRAGKSKDLIRELPTGQLKRQERQR